jgi:RNA polymerase sigma-70 factor (ECF subfamily)
MKGECGMFEVNLKECFLRMQSGDKEAFTIIYNELKLPVFTVVSRILQSKDLAEDVMQEVFVKLYTAPPDSSVRNLRAWIFQISRNLAIDALRKKQCLDVNEVELVEEDPTDGLLTQMDIEAAIRRLPRTEREIISLHINAQLHFREISTILGLSLPATYRRYRKALQTLQEYLEEGAV